MSFLDKIASTSQSAGNTVKINPLLKNKIKKEENEETPTRKILPLKKKIEIEEERTSSVSSEQETATPEQIVVAEITGQTIEELTAQTKLSEPVEMPVDELTEEENIESTDDLNSEEEDLISVEQKTAPMKRGRKKREPAKVVTEEVLDDAIVDMPTTSMSFSDAVSQITSPFVDEEWEAFKTEVQEEMSKIVIHDDINPGTLKVTISELSILREKIWYSYQQAKNLFEHLSAKDPEGLIERMKRINLGSGNNDMERKKAGVMACMHYPSGSGDINLYEVLDEARTRYNFLRGIREIIEYKTNALITMNGALKLEKNHIVNQ